ncbi:MAG: MBL fold metallo-hydrolase [Chitinophagaceae bacterium]
MQIIPLPEGVFTIDRSKIFQPFIVGEDELQKRPAGSLLVEVQPFLVITASDYILLDTGLGFKKNGVLQIHANLERHGISAEKITKVLLSHLHKDHAGGICYHDVFGNLQPSFPLATYYVQQKELNYASEKSTTSYLTETVTFLTAYEKVKSLDGRGNIDGYIEYSLSGGHSPFHQVFMIKEKDDIIFYGGDEAPQLQQMKHKVIAKYDHDGRISMRLRQQWWQQGNLENWSFLFYHDVKKPVFQNEAKK